MKDFHAVNIRSATDDQLYLNRLRADFMKRTKVTAVQSYGIVYQRNPMFSFLMYVQETLHQTFARTVKKKVHSIISVFNTVLTLCTCEIFAYM